VLTAEDIARRLADVRRRMDAAAARGGRAPGLITLIAVSKTCPVGLVRGAYAAGQADFGENKVQEGLQKIAEAAETRIRWHLIGHLQSNKARKAAAHFDWIHSVDSVELLRRLDEGAKAAGRTPGVLIQVDLAREPTKYGAVADEVKAIIEAGLRCEAVRLHGLMVLPPLLEDPEAVRPWFRQLRETRDRFVASGVPAERLAHLSMGMSHDFEVAIEEGATMVRVGTAIFGPRTGR
jgi:pyridoxal phosphate enzyme (YggS family)